jgi:hypothetical protein
MWGRLGPRFAVEALFLILVAVALGIADVRPLVIVLVMAGAWLLVSLIEVLASREPRYLRVEQRVDVLPPAPAPSEAASVVGADTEPGVPPDVEPEPVETEPVAEAGAAGELPAPAPVAAPVVAEGPRRRWFHRGGRADSEPPAQEPEVAGDSEPAAASEPQAAASSVPGDERER